MAKTFLPPPPPRQLIVFKVVTNLESVKILFKFQLLYWSIKGPQGAIKRLYNKHINRREELGDCH